MKNTILSILAAVSLISCTDFTDENHYVVPSIINPYVQNFFNEASAHGYNFDQSNITVEIVVMPDKAGFSYGGGVHHILIDTTSAVWKKNPEALVFHELSHSFLCRKHVFEKLPDNSVKSIMSIGVTNYYADTLSYRRKYYVNELFDHVTPAPEWAY